ncbi:MAG: hypothetical protein J6C85_00790 [Alphaproteobacteria bacterium]|nr:hypothetical protein [Alphaproteobacteria bacterium]
MSAKNVLKIFFCGFLGVGLLFTAWGVNAATPDCPDCPPDKDGSIFPGGSCENCSDPEDKDGSLFPGGSCERCSAKKKSDKVVRIVDAPRKRACPGAVAEGCPIYKTSNYVFAKPRYRNTIERNCCDMASFALEHVDFKLNGAGSYNPYSGHVGNYRFRIFGCRRATKKAMLNHGRVIQKNMAFQEVFKKAADKCYKVMEIPGDVCLSDPSVKLPEYVLTAEITNFFMNICDEYDWDKARKTNKRGGSAEMTVTWRLLDLSQTKVFWKGVTTGYAEVEDGVYEGEVKLAEESFADAASMLRTLPGFEAQLMVRPSAQEMAAQRAALVAFDEKFNPGKCGFAKEIAYTRSCAYAPQPQCPAMCPCAVQQPCVCNQPVCSCPQVSCPCAAPAKPKVEEFVDVKTEKKIIEKKIITTTRVETPAPVCKPVCQPVCQQPQVNCQLQCTQECEQPKCRKVCTKTCEEGNEDKCTEKCVEDCGEEPVVPSKVEEVVYVPAVEEDGGVEVSNQTVKPQIEEDGGVTDTHRVYENCIDENGDVIADGSCTVIDDNWVDLDGFSVDSKLCIVDRPPYKELSPENMLKIRSSVVDITNANGKQGIGLIISDSFVLTSASLVNKLKNTYDVKTINGDVLKAKAVRFNPSKNIALLSLEKPTTYTPLSLNLELPAIDQEGFISLGALGNGETAQNYMDDNGKIYGYRYSDTLGTEIIVDTLVQKVAVGSVLIDRLGTINGISNSAKQTKEGMDLFIPTETALRSVGLSICEKLYDKKSPWEKTVYKPVSEKIKQETKAPEAMKASGRK